MQAPDVTFIVFSDLHVDLMHDTVARMDVLLQEATRHQVDFIVHLGDYMYPDMDFLQKHAPESVDRLKTKAFYCERDDEKHAIHAMIKASGIPVYGVLGNHDMDSCSKATACRYFGMPGRYYCFDRGGVRFVALDTNFMRDGDEYIGYDHANYNYGHTPLKTDWVDPEQLGWLEETVMSSPFPCVLMSHAPIGDDLYCVSNADAVFAIIRRANQDRRRVVLAMNGHVHIDGICVREGVPFWDVNSMSNIWIGHKYDTVRYSRAIHAICPHLCATAPYWDALFARVTIRNNSIDIDGRESVFVGPSPQALGYPSSSSFHAPSARIADRSLPLDKHW